MEAAPFGQEVMSGINKMRYVLNVRILTQMVKYIVL